MGGDEQPSGTLSGTMTMGPMCPVEQINNPCKPTPAQFAAQKISVYTADRATLITTITPSSDGTFSTPLPAGTYYVALAAPRQGVGSVTGLPTTVHIQSGATAHVAINIDTGIR